MTTRQLLDNIYGNFPEILEGGFVYQDQLDIKIHRSEIDPDDFEGIIMRLYFLANDPDKAIKYFILQYSGGRYIYFSKIREDLWLFVLCEYEAFSKLHFYIKYLLSESGELSVEEDTKQKSDIVEKVSSARRIQELLFQDPIPHLKIFKNPFLYFQPKEDIGGDYYWSRKTKKNLWIVVGDCTGHSVEGALATVSILSIINQIFDDNLNPHILVKELYRSLNNIQKQKLEDGYGIGNEMLVLKINLSTQELLFAGTGLPVYVHNTKLQRMRTKKVHFEEEKVLKYIRSRKLHLKPNDFVFTHSDGLIDQLNEHGKRLGYQRLTVPLKEGRPIDNKSIEHLLNEWKRAATQTDDIVVLGFTVK